MALAPPVFDLAPQLENYRRYWRGWDMTDDPRGALETYRSGVPFLRLNGVSHSEARPGEVIETVTQRMHGVPWNWEVTAQSHPETRRTLTEWGAPHYGTATVMAADLTTARGPEWGTVQEQDVARDPVEWVHGYAAAMAVPSAAVAQIAALEPWRRYEDATLVRYTYVADGAVRATTELLLTGEVAGIYLVATQEGYRRRGVATALVSTALARARDEGARVGTLQSTPMGEPVYRRLGFEAVGEIHMYGPPPRS